MPCYYDVDDILMEEEVTELVLSSAPFMLVRIQMA
jgi:hypothetical protein